ncbi:hypothetical protein [Sandaracinus amylolyticus]|uniref:hypothetical protein n=1 Tax=Sandaracinus amylolyticus TaxID=927083 RepID=UPI001F209826|nr:hypothetical protein [Sandaracinus amylolyticus]
MSRNDKRASRFVVGAIAGAAVVWIVLVRSCGPASRRVRASEACHYHDLVAGSDARFTIRDSEGDGERLCVSGEWVCKTSDWRSRGEGALRRSARRADRLPGSSSHYWVPAATGCDGVASVALAWCDAPAACVVESGWCVERSRQALRDCRTGDSEPIQLTDFASNSHPVGVESLGALFDDVTAPGQVLDNVLRTAAGEQLSDFRAPGCEE